MQADRLDSTYRALGDQSRRAILQHLAHAKSQSLTISELAAPLPLALPTVLKHLAVLERAKLVRRQKTGRTVNVTLDPKAMTEAMAWLTRTEAYWTSRLDRLAESLQPAKKMLSSKGAGKP